MVVRVSHKNPFEARKVIEALASKPKLEIIKLLIEEGPMTASEISSRLNISLSTIMDHLNHLTSSNILTWKLEKRRGKFIKVYRVRDLIWDIKIDLRLYSTIPDSKMVIELAREYIKRKVEGEGLPIKITAKDIMKTLNLNLNQSLTVLNYLTSCEDEITEILAELFNNSSLRDEKEVLIKDLAEKLNIHIYWAYRLAGKLTDSGEYIFKEDRLIRVKEES